MMSDDQKPLGDVGNEHGGVMIRRASGEWKSSDNADVTSTLSDRGMLSRESGGADGNIVRYIGGGEENSGETTSQVTMATLPYSIINSSLEFRELIEMIFYSYLEYGETQWTEQFRDLVEAFLCPIFDRANTSSTSTPNNATPSPYHQTGVPFPSLTTTSTTCINSVITPVVRDTALSYSVESCTGSTSSASVASVALVTSSCSASPPTVVDDSVGESSAETTSIDSSSVKDVAVCGEMSDNIDTNFVCPVCYGIFVEPVTLSCGHSYCKMCIDEIVDLSCRLCSHIFTGEEAKLCKNNVLLGDVVQKWWPEQVAAAKLRNQGNILFENKQMHEALEKYNDALILVPDNHLSLCKRSHCLLTIGRSEAALKDAKLAIKCCPMWPRGYFCQSAALISLGRYENSFLSLTQCINVVKFNCCKTYSEGPTRTSVISEMTRILQKIFLHSARAALKSTLKRHSNTNSAEHIQYTPYPGARRRQGWRVSGQLNSSEDESDHVLQTHRQQHTWKSNRNLHHHGRLRERTLPRSSSSSTMIEQLSLRMSLLFNRARHDLRTFENGQKADVSQRIKTKPSVRTPQVCHSDLDCVLCTRLLYQPVTTKCGHTFCKSCLDRSSDHFKDCPLCKGDLKDYCPFRKQAVNVFLEVALKRFLPNAYDARLKMHKMELGGDIPIFVCTIAFPTITCPLHVFEPRYRLMIRRCIENKSNKFGMCCFMEGKGNAGNFGEIGTLLEIRSIQYFADGRSVLDTVGCRRFRVRSRKSLDGYNTAKIEFLDDDKIPETEIAAVNKLHDNVLKEANEWLESIGPVRYNRIIAHFGKIPSPESDWITSKEGPSWMWWLLAILPIESKCQLAILSMCSLKRRLECILKVITAVKKRMGSMCK